MDTRLQFKKLALPLLAFGSQTAIFVAETEARNRRHRCWCCLITVLPWPDIPYKKALHLNRAV